MLVEQENQGATQPPHRRINYLKTLLRRWGLSLFSFLLVAAAAAPVLYQKSLPTYAAESLLLVSPVFAKNLREDREFQIPRYDEFVNQQLVLAVQEDVTLDALDRMGENRSLWQRPGESRREAASRLSSELVADRVKGTSYIGIRLTGRKPEGLAEVVNAVADSYIARIRGQAFQGQDIRLEALNRRKIELEQQISAKTDLLARWAKELGVTGFTSDSPDSAFHEAERTLAAARTSRIEAEARLAAFEAASTSNVPFDPGFEAINLLSTDAELNGLRTVLLGQKNTLKEKLLGLTPQHPERKSIEQRLENIDKELKSAEKTSLERIRKTLEQRHERQLKEDRRKLREEFDQAQRYEQILREKTTTVSESLLRSSNEAQTVQQEVDRLRRQLSQIQDRIDFIRLETNAPGYVHLVARATLPDAPQKSTLPKWAAVFAVGALGVALLVPLLIESRRPRIWDTSDLESAANINALCWIPERVDGAEMLARDQIRRLALALDREWRLKGRSRFVFTSVRKGGGTTRLIFDVARELRTLGARVVAVEANAFNPDPRFATKGEHKGLIWAAAGWARLDEVVVPAANGLPNRVQIGTSKTNTLLAGFGNLRPLMDGLKDRFDIVLIDGPPILLSSDAELLAGVADGAVLIVEAGKASMDDVVHAKRILARVRPPVLETVVNRVKLGPGTGTYTHLVREHAARQPAGTQ